MEKMRQIEGERTNHEQNPGRATAITKLETSSLIK
jgi:hypothetical protein